MDPIIPSGEINGNPENEFDEISLDQSDEVFKYTVVPNALIRDATISPQCRWLIIYLMSNEKHWKIKSKQLWSHTKGFIGRDGIRKIINEAIEAGYMQRNIVLRETAKGKLRGYSYLVASTPKFKKVLRETDFQAPDHQAPDNQGTKELPREELLSKEEYSSLKVPKEPMAAKAAEKEKDPPPKPKRDKPEFLTKVREVGQQLIGILIQHEPDYSPPKNLAPFLTEVDFMLRLDKRDPQKVADVLSWALADSFWRDKMFKPNPAKYLREKFLQLKNKMEAKPQENTNKVDRRLRDKEGNTSDDWKDNLF